MPTFSEIVDQVAIQSGYQSNLGLVAGFVNNAMHGLTPLKHHSQLREVTYYPEKSHKFKTSHSFPIPEDLATIRAVRVDGRVFVSEKKPGLGQVLIEDHYFYYLIEDQLAVRGPISDRLELAYYKVLRNFLYYPREKRLLREATSEGQHRFEYRVPQTDEWIPYNRSAPDQRASYDRHMNWILDHHHSAVTNGALSSALNARGDIEAGGRLFQAFNQEKRLIMEQHTGNNHGES